MKHMDPSKDFMSWMNQGSPNQNSESGSQSSPPTQFSPNFPQSQYSQFFAPPSYLQNFHPFGPPSNYHHSPRSFQGVHQPVPAIFQGAQPEESSLHSLYQVFGRAASMPPSMLHHNTSVGGVGNTSSHGSESNSPCPASQKEKEPVNVEVSSSSEEGGRKGTRMNWTEQENLRLLTSWLNNSVDPIDGNDKKSDYYWRAVAAEYNSNTAINSRKRTVMQCKTHWGGIKRDVTKFCGVYSRARSTYCSGQSDDMLMDKAREWFKKENKGKPFTLEYMWKELKDQPKWRRIAQQDSKNKRTKVSESGAYTSSSNQDTEEESSKEKRPEGQKRAKARQKRKGKGPCGAPSPLGDQPCHNMVLFHEAVKIRAAAIEKTAEAAAKSAEAKKEQTKMERLQTYLKLLDKDTSGYSEARLRRHEGILDQLGKELGED
ncbi:hypothetical protein ACP4OV_007387 [Aristida adscensionis]